MKAQAYSKLGVYTITFPDPTVTSNENLLDAGSAVTDFTNIQLEQIIIDKKSKGFLPRNLVYIPEKQLLVTCSINGNVLLWSMSENIQCIGELFIRNQIQLAKLLVGTEATYLVICAKNFIHIYNTVEQIPTIKRVIRCDSPISDVGIILQGNKLICIEWGYLIHIYDLETFKCEISMNALDHGAKAPLFAAFYLVDRHALAIEDNKGVCVIDLNGNKKNDLVFHEQGKTGHGFCYLARSREFMTRKDNNGALILSEDKLSVNDEYPTHIRPILNTTTPELHFIPNEDESQIVSNANSKNLLVYTKSGYNILRLDGLLRKSALELRL